MSDRIARVRHSTIPHLEYIVRRHCTIPAMSPRAAWRSVMLTQSFEQRATDSWQFHIKEPVELNPGDIVTVSSSDYLSCAKLWLKRLERGGFLESFFCRKDHIGDHWAKWRLDKLIARARRRNGKHEAHPV